jgi:hypothetical protein
MTPAHIQDTVTAPDDLIRTLLHRVNHLEAQLSSKADCAQLGGPSPSLLASSCPQPYDIHDGAATPAHAQSNAPELPSSSNQEDTGSVVPEDDDAATVLEFLAWGRNKDAEYGTTTDQASREILMQEDHFPASDAVFDGSRQATFDLLEILLPDRTHIYRLVEYHNNYILWYHGSYSAWIFSHNLDKFLLNRDGDIRHPELDVQWLGLLFAILTGSLACAPSSVRHSWGFQDAESSKLALQWYEACVSCLNTGHYIERHTIHSVEAIATLTISAHILGRSDSQSILLSSAGRIAQSLGLHRLSGDAHGSMDQMRRIEAGRRVFNQLCTQDWFQIPFSESYSLNPNFIRSQRPTNCNDDDLERRPECVPTQASYCNYRHEIAALMPRLLDASSQCNTLFTKYEQVLKFDERMRKLATASMPPFLSTSAPIDPDWPAWIGWGRRSLAICASHKIIMIHRRFLGLSFTNTAFSFTRRTCVAAAKTILKEALSAKDQEGPIIWIEQAFSVAAGIVLCLDIAHREPDQGDLEHHATLMERTITYLRSFEASKIASRGAQLLSTLQREVQRGSFRRLGTRRRRDASFEPVRPTKRIRTSHNMPEAPGTAVPDLTGAAATNLLDASNPPLTTNPLDDNPYQYPIDISLGPQDLFDDLLSFRY